METYELIVPIEIGDKTITILELAKPTLGKLTKVRSDDPYTKALEMLTACCTNASQLELKRLSFDDVQEVMENVLPDFLGLTDAIDD